MRIVHEALIKAEEGWLTINELVDIAYPEYGTWQQREVHRFAVRKAVAALRRDWVEGVRVVREGSGSEERVRADLSRWTGRHLKTPPKRIRTSQPLPTAGRWRGEVGERIGLPAVDDYPRNDPPDYGARSPHAGSARSALTSSRVTT